MICQWEHRRGIYTCQTCRATRRSLVHRNCPGLPCPYLGQPIEGDSLTLKVTCPGCGGKKLKTKKLSLIVHDCCLKGRCLPNYSCAKTAITEEIVSGEWAQSCSTCEFNPRNTQPQTTRPAE